MRLEMHIHIATLGERTEPILKGFNLIPGIEKVYLMHSGRYVDSALSVKDFLDSGGIDSRLVEVDEFDFSDVMERISQVFDSERPYGPHTFSINVTGGTKLMAFAAYSSAYFIGATVYYVQERNDLPLQKQLLTIMTTKAPKSGRSDKKGREILRFVYGRTLNGGSVSSQDIESEFGMKKQQVSYYIRNLREEGLIVTEMGIYDPIKKAKDFRHNSIKLTQQGQMEARFVRDV